MCQLVCKILVQTIMDYGNGMLSHTKIQGEENFFEVQLGDAISSQLQQKESIVFEAKMGHSKCKLEIMSRGTHRRRFGIVCAKAKC